MTFYIIAAAFSTLRVISVGNFGRVHIGRLAHDLYEQPIPVAIKTLRGEYYIILRVSTVEQTIFVFEFETFICASQYYICLVFAH